MSFYQTVQELNCRDIMKEHIDERILHVRMLVIAKYENEAQPYYLTLNLSILKLLIFVMCHNGG